MIERTVTDSRVLVAGGVAIERLKTAGRVVSRVGVIVMVECLIAIGRVVVGSGVAKERFLTGGRVIAAGGVAIER